MPLVPKSDFLNLDGVTHLAAGGQTPSLKTHADALAAFVQAKGTGLAAQRAYDEVRRSTAERAARLLGCEADDIGFPASVAQGVAILADSIDWRPGDNVVLEAWEFPSLMLPWLTQRRHGVEVRALRPKAGWAVPLDEMRRAIDARTRVVALSHVSYLTGERHDLEAYAELAREAGALFVVDASHALGAVPVRAEVADFAFACCYKFVLGVQGAAIAFWNRRRQPDWRPALTGWHSIESQPPLSRSDGVTPRRTGMAFEPGNPAWSALFVLNRALGYLGNLSPAAIEAHVVGLSGALRERLAALDLPLMTPEAPDHRAANVAFDAPDAFAIRDALERNRVLINGEDGRVRLSVHVYNDLDDVERGVAALGEVLRHRSA